MKSIQLLLVIVCLLLAGGIGYFAGTENKPKYIQVKLSDTPEVVLIIDSSTGLLVGRYWRYGEYNAAPPTY